MKKLDIRFCSRNLTAEQSNKVMEYLEKKQQELINISVERCLGNCSICNQGPYCTVNDFLFQNKTPDTLQQDLEKIFADLRKSLNEYYGK